MLNFNAIFVANVILMQRNILLRTKDEILPLAKQLMQQVEFHTHTIRLLGLGVSNQKIATPQEEPQWVELELEFEPWPDVS